MLTIPPDLSHQLFTTFADLRVTRNRASQIARWFLATLGIDACSTPDGGIVLPDSDLSHAALLEGIQAGAELLLDSRTSAGEAIAVWADIRSHVATIEAGGAYRPPVTEADALHMILVEDR